MNLLDRLDLIRACQIDEDKAIRCEARPAPDGLVQGVQGAGDWPHTHTHSFRTWTYSGGGRICRSAILTGTRTGGGWDGNGIQVLHRR